MVLCIGVAILFSFSLIANIFWWVIAKKYWDFHPLQLFVYSGNFVFFPFFLATARSERGKTSPHFWGEFWRIRELSTIAKKIPPWSGDFRQFRINFWTSKFSPKNETEFLVKHSRPQTAGQPQRRGRGGKQVGRIGVTLAWGRGDGVRLSRPGFPTVVSPPAKYKELRQTCCWRYPTGCKGGHIRGGYVQLNETNMTHDHRLKKKYVASNRNKTANIRILEAAEKRWDCSFCPGNAPIQTESQLLLGLPNTSNCFEGRFHLPIPAVGKKRGKMSPWSWFRIAWNEIEVRDPRWIFFHKYICPHNYIRNTCLEKNENAPLRRNECGLGGTVSTQSRWIITALSKTHPDCGCDCEIVVDRDCGIPKRSKSTARYTNLRLGTL